MSDISEVSSLRWLSNMFPFTKVPLDETDRISNVIHVYCHAGANKIEAMQKEIEMLKAYIEHLESRRN